MRERLIALIREADEYAASKVITDYDEAVADNADYLVAHGVTVMMAQQWVMRPEGEFCRTVKFKYVCSGCGAESLAGGTEKHCHGCGAKMGRTHR